MALLLSLSRSLALLFSIFATLVHFLILINFIRNKYIRILHENVCVCVLNVNWTHCTWTRMIDRKYQSAFICTLHFLYTLKVYVQIDRKLYQFTMMNAYFACNRSYLHAYECVYVCDKTHITLLMKLWSFDFHIDGFFPIYTALVM